MSDGPAYRTPPGVEFQRWREGGPDGTGEWVVYHSGTGETLRLTEAAVLILDALIQQGPASPAALAGVLARALEEEAPAQELERVLHELLAALKRHECIEPLPCD